MSERITNRRHCAFLVGQRFERLTVLSHAGKHGASHYSTWLCRCDCGGTTITGTANLRSGNTKSCGCLFLEANRSKLPAALRVRRANRARWPDGKAAFNLHLIRYRKGAEVRGLSFDLTVDEFRVLTQMPCHYCGVSPSMTVKTPRGDKYIVSGVDRVDNSLGYSVENCVACCSLCNRAKSSMRVDNFLAWIKRISDFTARKELFLSSNPQMPKQVIQ